MRQRSRRSCRRTGAAPGSRSARVHSRRGTVPWSREARRRSSACLRRSCPGHAHVGLHWIVGTSPAPLARAGKPRRNAARRVQGVDHAWLGCGRQRRSRAGCRDVAELAANQPEVSVFRRRRHAGAGRVRGVNRAARRLRPRGIHAAPGWRAGRSLWHGTVARVVTFRLPGDRDATAGGDDHAHAGVAAGVHDRVAAGRDGGAQIREHHRARGRDTDVARQGDDAAGAASRP